MDKEGLLEEQKNRNKKIHLTDAKRPLRRPRLHDPRAESPSGNATPTRTLCDHTRRCV